MNRMLGAKISRHIRFPTVLNIRPYMSKAQVIRFVYRICICSGACVKKFDQVNWNLQIANDDEIKKVVEYLE